MGAWGAEIFENDDACDFAAEVVEDRDFARLEAALDGVLNIGGEYLEAPAASEGLAAADIVARFRGNRGQSDSYTAKIDEWVAESGHRVNDGLLRKARLAVQRVRTSPSELLELWGEGDPADFNEAIKNLSTRLQ